VSQTRTVVERLIARVTSLRAARAGEVDRAWQAYLLPQAERVAALARVLVAGVSVGWWWLGFHAQPGRMAGVPVVDVAAAVLTFALALAALTYARPRLFERTPAATASADIALVALWLVAMGVNAPAFAPLAVLGAASAAMRAPTWAGTAAAAAFSLLALRFGGPHAGLLAVYTGVLGVGMAAFARAVHADRYNSLRDPLTGVFSRRYGLYRLGLLVRERQYPFCLGVLDLDDFKRINDAYGHPVGDQVLASLATLIQAHLRQGDAVVRLGGDEFLLLLPRTTLAGASTVAERLREVLAESGVAGAMGARVGTTASIGLVEAVPGATPERLIERADACLYQAKRRRNAVVTAAG
jgi:diguanylate cyclase (GGDEF)-like protein